MRTMLARLAVLVAAIAAMVAPVAGPAAAQPVNPTPINCWNEFETVKQGQTITISAFKDCVHLNAPQPLSLSLQIWVCDEDGDCYWVTWKSGVGVVTYTCPGTFWSPFRSSRLPSKVVHCHYY
jgi:hypothetical protein